MWGPGSGRLIQDQHAGLHGEDGSYGHPLLLPAGQLVDVPSPEIRRIDQRKRSLDTLPDLVEGQSQVLRAEGDLVVDLQGAELRFRSCCTMPTIEERSARLALSV